MAEDAPEDKISELIEDGWDVRGYSVCVTAGGSLVHNFLLQKDKNLEGVSIVTSSDKEQGRRHHAFVPPPEKKKGWF